MDFEKRDIILIVGVLLLIIGSYALVPQNLIQTIVISIAIFFGIKIFVARRKKMLDKKIGEGFCAECGEKIIRKKCPNCDNEKK